MPGKSPALSDNGSGLVRENCHSLNGLPHELSACCIDNSYRKTPRRPTKIPQSETKSGHKTANSAESIVQLQGPRYKITPYPWSSSPLLDEVPDNNKSDVNFSPQDPYGPHQVPLDLGRVILFPDGRLYCVRYFTRSDQNFLLPCDPDKAQFYSLLRLPCDVLLWDTAGEQLERVCVSRTASHAWSNAIASGQVPTVRTPVLASTSDVNLLDRITPRQFSSVESQDILEPFPVSCQHKESKGEAISTKADETNSKKSPSVLIPSEVSTVRISEQMLCTMSGHFLAPTILPQISNHKAGLSPSNVQSYSGEDEEPLHAHSHLSHEATECYHSFPGVTKVVQHKESCPAWTQCSLNKILDSGYSSLECCGITQVGFDDIQKDGSAPEEELISTSTDNVPGEDPFVHLQQGNSDCLASVCKKNDCKDEDEEDSIDSECLEEDGAPDNSRLERSCRRSLNFGVPNENETSEQLSISPSLLYRIESSSSECDSCHDTTDSLSYELDYWSSDEQDDPCQHLAESMEGPFKNLLKRTTASQSYPRLIDGRELSFEGNQSFPKARQITSSASLVSAKDTTNTDLRHITNLENENKVVPRNRRSLYASSTLDRCSSFLNRSMVEGDSGKEPSQQNPTVGLVEVLPLFDICPNLLRPPSLNEILFNSVTSCICVINPANNGKIVSINEQFQLLIGIHEKVVGQKFFQFIKIRQGDTGSLKNCCSKPFVLSNRHPVSVCGKLVWCRVGNGQEYPLSLWVAPFDVNPSLTICILDHTYSLPTTEVTRLGRKSQSVGCVEKKLGRKLEQKSLPLTCKQGAMMLGKLDSQDTDVFCNMESLVILDKTGKILVHDQTFWNIHFGYARAPIQLAGVLRDICSVEKDVPSESRSDEALRCSTEMALGDTPQLSVSYLPECSRPQLHDSLQLHTDVHLELASHCFAQGPDPAENDCDIQTGQHLSFHGAHMYTSTPYKHPTRTSGAHTMALNNGVYTGSILHHDGSKIAVTFKVGTLVCQCLGQGHRRFCVWICPRRQQEWWSHCGPSADSHESESENDSCSDDGQVELEECDNSRLTHSGSDDTDQSPSEEDLTSSCNGTVDPSLGQLVLRQAALNRSDNASIAEDKLDLALALDDWLAERYVTLVGLGQGSYGFVRRALRVGSNKEDTVVIKFIRKNKMHPSGWVEDVKAKQMVPLEVAILSEISDKSKYIIRLHEYHMNESFVQVVMEDFGKMDLFDFIDQVEIDESLARHIFMQVLKGVHFLASVHILHRDIKDENVVINDRFECKLIDFGSSAYMLPEGEWFEEFRGTKEYCSPEVWHGDRYRGPEQEIWALGVTLFTVMFAVNPYSANQLPYQLTADDFPFTTSADLCDLLLHLLQCEPQKRLTLEGALNHPWCVEPLDVSPYRWQDVFGNEEQMDDLRSEGKSPLAEAGQADGCHKWTHDLG